MIAVTRNFGALTNKDFNSPVAPSNRAVFVEWVLGNVLAIPGRNVDNQRIVVVSGGVLLNAESFPVAS